eukprot:Phypoly_transcript_13501.p1 GENE.Phypoly_transcript_13501~~Phypoly_transcript_13501.p1  ORF type:complete len:318 (+),score=80.27 Phypoly_transcript_13501:85-1038(+)
MQNPIATINIQVNLKIFSDPPMQQANKHKRPLSPSKDKSSSPVHSKRREEGREEGDRRRGDRDIVPRREGGDVRRREDGDQRRENRRDDRDTIRRREGDRRESSPVQHKRRREERDEGERKSDDRQEERSNKEERDNRPRYYQSSNPNIPRALMDKENDEKKLAARQKQIDFGKNTIGYQNYIAAIPRSQRKRTDIWTPDKHYRCSKRSWDGQVRQWRRLLHEYDPKAAEGEIEIDLENEEEDISHLQKELEEDRNAEDKENNKDEENRQQEREPKHIKVEKDVRIEIKTEGKAEEFVFTKLPFSEPLDHESWCDMV